LGEKNSRPYGYDTKAPDRVLGEKGRKRGLVKESFKAAARGRK